MNKEVNPTLEELNFKLLDPYVHILKCSNSIKIKIKKIKKKKEKPVHNYNEYLITYDYQLYDL